MTTVVDPLGTPVPIFNRSGTAIVNLEAEGDSVFEGPIIPAVCGHVIAVVNCTENNFYVRLSNEFEIGSLVEIYMDRASTFGGIGIGSISPDTFGTQNSPSTEICTASCGIMLRKISETGWMSTGFNN